MLPPYLICATVFHMQVTVNLDVQLSLSLAANRTASAMLSVQDADGVSTIDRPTLGVITGLSRQTIWRAISELKKRDLVVEKLPGIFIVSETLGRRIS